MRSGTKEVGMRLPKNLEIKVRGRQREREREREKNHRFGNISLEKERVWLLRTVEILPVIIHISRKCCLPSLGINLVSHD
jgi:hypothetical protein